jgi:hypothetical protein
MDIKKIAIVITGVFLLVCAAYINFLYNPAAPHVHGSRSSAQYASFAEMEALTGIRVTLIGVTAAGGMVDFRFKVLDAEKATLIFQDHATMPVLSLKDSKIRIMMPQGATHSMSFENGKVYYMLFGNPGGAIRPGSQVILTIGGLRVGPIMAQ